MQVDKPYPITFAGDWEPENVYSGYFSGAWSGGISPLVTKEVADLIVKNQDEFLAELDEEIRSEQDFLKWEDDVLVHTSGQDSEYVGHAEPMIIETTDGHK